MSDPIFRFHGPEADALKAMLADPVALRANILRHSPAGFDLYSAEHIERIKAEAVRQVETKLNDALAELYHAKENQLGKRHPERPEMARDVGGDNRTGLDGTPAAAGIQAPVETQPQKAGGLPL